MKNKSGRLAPSSSISPDTVEDLWGRQEMLRHAGRACAPAAQHDRQEWEQDAPATMETNEDENSTLAGAIAKGKLARQPFEE